MKKILLSTVAVFGFTASTLAADLPSRRPAPYVAAVPLFTWTGFYVGLNAGWGFAGDSNDEFNPLLLGGLGGFGGGGALNVATSAITVAPVVPAAGVAAPAFFGGFVNEKNRDGFGGGAQIGYNYQFTPGSGFVIGFEADIQFTDIGGGNNNNNLFGLGGFGGNSLFTAVPVAPGVAPFGIAVGTGAAGVGAANVALFNSAFGTPANASIDWFGTARLRLGYAFDRVLVYVTGGVAFTDANNNNGIGAAAFGFGNGAAVPANFFVSPAAVAAGALVNGGFLAAANRDDVGYAIGGGIEYAFTNNLTAKIEGLYVDFGNGNNNNAFAGAFGNGVVGVSNTGAPITRAGIGLGGLTAASNRLDFSMIRVGVNYKFMGW